MVLGATKIGIQDGVLEGSYIASLRPWDAQTADDVLRGELATQGVLWVKNAIPRDYVLAMRRRYFDGVAPSGILKSDSQPVDGIFCGDGAERFVWPRTDALRPPMGDGETDYAVLSAKMHTEEWTNDFAGNPYIMGLLKRLYPSWKRPSVLRRQIFRAIPPKTNHLTGIHYDLVFLRHGPPNAVTAWVPIGDCQPDMGGLIYLEDSLPVGRQMEDSFDQMCNDKGMTLEERRSAYNTNMTSKNALHMTPVEFSDTIADGRKWLVGDYEAGDLVFHLMRAPTLYTQAGGTRLRLGGYACPQICDMWMPSRNMIGDGLDHLFLEMVFELEQAETPKFSMQMSLRVDLQLL